MIKILVNSKNFNKIMIVDNKYKKVENFLDLVKKYINEEEGPISRFLAFNIFTKDYKLVDIYSFMVNSYSGRDIDKFFSNILKIDEQEVFISPVNDGKRRVNIKVSFIQGIFDNGVYRDVHPIVSKSDGYILVFESKMEQDLYIKEENISEEYCREYIYELNSNGFGFSFIYIKEEEK